ncbi:MAG TPA: hypothetical protein VGP82_09440, partial [Ktedonobacterales bacterium]|nr:hypothetical protein [Ktedonobacterales bacterium]
PHHHPGVCGATYAGAFPNARFELIKDAGHLPQIEQPTATFAAIDAYMDAWGKHGQTGAIVLESGSGRSIAIGPVRLSVKEDGGTRAGHWRSPSSPSRRTHPVLCPTCIARTRRGSTSWKERSSSRWVERRSE